MYKHTYTQQHLHIFEAWSSITCCRKIYISYGHRCFRGASVCFSLGHGRGEESKHMGQTRLARAIHLACAAMVNHSVKLLPHGHGPSPIVWLELYQTYNQVSVIAISNYPPRPCAGTASLPLWWPCMGSSWEREGWVLVMWQARGEACRYRVPPRVFMVHPHRKAGPCSPRCVWVQLSAWNPNIAMS